MITLGFQACVRRRGLVSDELMVDRWLHRSVPNDPPSRWRRALGRRGLRRGLLVLVLAAACAGLFAVYFRQSLTAPFNSDGAANVLQAQAIIQGNPLLRGWWTSDVSFYTTELPEYALVTAIHGLSPNVVHVCGALTYTLTVLLDRTGRPRPRAGRGRLLPRGYRHRDHPRAERHRQHRDLPREPEPRGHRGPRAGPPAAPRPGGGPY